MRRCLLLLTLFLLAAPALADPFRPPRADAHGDYREETFHEYWQVVDPDPQGLAARRHGLLPLHTEGEPSWPDRHILSWPTVRRLKKGTVLVLEPGVANPMLDDRHKPWLAVWRLGHAEEGFFLVRANKAFLRPVRHPLPEPDSRGDYSGRTEQSRWKVVDPDPAGLNGRMSPRFPADPGDARAEWPPLAIGQWPVVARFAPGTVLTAVRGNVGSILVEDLEGRPWLLVRTPRGGLCFVRANQKFLRPLASEIEP